MRATVGTSARQLYEESIYYDNSEVIIEQAPEFAVLREIKIKREKEKSRFRLVFTVLLIFVLGLVIMFRYASITEISNNINEMNRDYANLKAESEILKANIAKEISLAKISEIAVNELGMQKPKSYQLVHISLNPIDYTEAKSIELTKDNEDSPWYQMFFNEIKLFLGLA